MLMILHKKTIIREHGGWSWRLDCALFPEPAVKQPYGKFAPVDTRLR